MITRTPLKRRSTSRKTLRFGGVRQNPAYLVFIRTFPCILHGTDPHVCSGKVEAAHTGPRGRGQKAVDESALPMCVNLHRTGGGAHHKLGRNFWTFHGLNQAELITRFNELFKTGHVAE